MDKNELKEWIEATRGSVPYGAWTIGITVNPAERKKAHEADNKNVVF